MYNHPTLGRPTERAGARPSGARNLRALSRFRARHGTNSTSSPRSVWIRLWRSAKAKPAAPCGRHYSGWLPRPTRSYERSPESTRGTDGSPRPTKDRVVRAAELGRNFDGRQHRTHVATLTPESAGTRPTSMPTFPCMSTSRAARQIIEIV